MKQGLAFLFGVMCGVAGLTHVFYWLLIVVVGVVAYFHGIHLR